MSRSLPFSTDSSRSRVSWSRVSTRVLTVVAIAAVSACGGASDDAQSSQAETAQAESSTETATETATGTAAPATTVAATTTSAPVTTDEPTTTAAPVTSVAAMSPEFAAFAEANGDLVNEWSEQLSAFGEKAVDHLDDVSKAPFATSLVELSADVVEAVDPNSTDRGLVTLRAFADGIASAIGFAADGDHESALSIFLGLQSQSEALTAVLDQFEA